LVVWKEPCGLVEESFGTAFALRDVWAGVDNIHVVHPCPHSPASRPQGPQGQQQGKSFWYLEIYLGFRRFLP